MEGKSPTQVLRAGFNPINRVSDTPTLHIPFEWVEAPLKLGAKRLATSRMILRAAHNSSCVTGFSAVRVEAFVLQQKVLPLVFIQAP